MGDIEKLAIDDARQRHKALIDLVLSTDRQAMTLFSFCGSICAASGSGMVAIAFGSSNVPSSAGVVLLVICVGFAIAATLCLQVMKLAPIFLPGRDPDFWEWAIDNNMDGAEIAKAYLASIAKRIEENRSVNRAMAMNLNRARQMVLGTCLAAPFSGAGWFFGQEKLISAAKQAANYFLGGT